MSLALLERIALFRCLNPADARALAKVCRLQVCGRGDTVFAEGSRAKETSFVALEPSTIIRAPERDIFALTDRHPEILRQLLQPMMGRLVQLGQRVSGMTGSVETRVAKALRDLVETAGEVRPSLSLSRGRTSRSSPGPPSRRPSGSWASEARRRSS